MKDPTATMRRVDTVVRLTARLAVRSGRRRVPAPAVDRDLRLTVAEVHAEAPDVAGLTLTGSGPLPGWRPGAHLDVVLPSGLVRQYSLCGDPARPAEYRIAVRRIGPGSQEVHRLRAGDTVTVRGPRNAFPFVAAPRYLFLAGGIGITPLAAMARAAADADWRLVHVGRDRGSLPLSAGLDPARVRLRPDDEYGGPPTADELLDGWTPGTSVYCCGPPPMIDAVRRAMPAGRPFHSERFSPPPIRGGRPFVIEIDGVPVPVPADRSALDAVLAVRPDVAYSCRQGFCGTCHVPLLAGDTDRDTAGPGRMALCVARAAGESVAVAL